MRRLPFHMLRPGAHAAALASLLGLCLTATPVLAQDTGGLLESLSGAFTDAAPGSDERATLSGRILQFIALMTVLSVAPGLLMIMTCFTRFVIVFSILRSALGLNQTPPNMVLTSMALFMTFFVMQPVLEDAWEGGLRPLLNNSITEEQAIERVGAPFKTFMFANTRPKDLALFRDLAARADGTPAVATPDPVTAEEAGWRELVPAFMISELRRAFAIGFLVYLPFVAIDLIVASVLMSAGMMMLPPVLISLPFKIIFFVLIDGWYMLAGSLMESYMPLGQRLTAPLPDASCPERNSPMSSTSIEHTTIPSRAGRKLRGPEKAAILFLCLGEKRGSELMKKLDDNDIQKITRAISGLGVVPAPLVEEVMNEFSESIANGGSIIGSLAIAENMLKTFLPPEQVAAILKEIRGPLQERDLWSRLGMMNETVIAEYLKGEHEQTVAAILSKLPTEAAAKALTSMPPERMQAVVERMIRMKAVPADTMRQIEETLQRDLVANAGQAGATEAQQRMADLFNKLDREVFEALSEKLEQRMPRDFGNIRQKMFTFDDLMKLDLQSLARVMRGLQGNTLPLALRGASKEMRDQFLEALPARSRDMLLDEMNMMGAVRGRDVRAAQTAIVDCARDLAAQEIIRLPFQDDDDEMIT